MQCSNRRWLNLEAKTTKGNLGASKGNHDRWAVREGGYMTLRMRVGLLLLMCVAFVGAAIGLRGQAQAPPTPQTSDERIISGADLGFRIDSQGRHGIRGTLMVRIDGKWVPVNGPGTVPLHAR